MNSEYTDPSELSSAKTQPIVERTDSVVAENIGGQIGSKHSDIAQLGVLDESLTPNENERLKELQLKLKNGDMEVTDYEELRALNEAANYQSAA